MDYKAINKASWNKRTELHIDSDFYNNEAFIKGKNSLNKFELDILGDLTGKKILHLQCHFGQDTISLTRLGAEATGVDLSDVAIENAKELASKTNSNAKFICSDIYDLPNHLEGEFDLIFTSYGTIGWLPDLDKWATILDTFLKPQGKFVIVEFHPAVWMFDDDFTTVKYNYFNTEPIIENTEGTYAEKDAEQSFETVTWNHPISEVLTSLFAKNIKLDSFKEYDYSPYDCFAHTEEFEPGKFRIKHFGNRLPMVYSIEATKV